MRAGAGPKAVGGVHCSGFLQAGLARREASNLRHAGACFCGSNISWKSRCHSISRATNSSSCFFTACGRTSGSVHTGSVKKFDVSDRARMDSPLPERGLAHSGVARVGTAPCRHSAATRSVTRNWFHRDKVDVKSLVVEQTDSRLDLRWDRRLPRNDKRCRRLA